ncbi:NADH-quinone oxidoreductase subunit NuoF [Neomoorella thermoacetica]|uniref:NADH-quinone oxidoreductase subunit NuoF n=1 Tax=Neomoorella thermoacetica TaxID=1525 RepID=UPI0008FB5C53|nr:NADH-quinone oxidoreductase subunit NuoF [Moorella thermoacetica]OIQ62775.1 NADP-reducing hydrogenase subunit HndC [Moorella thermoacetica]
MGRILVCAGTGCVASHSRQVTARLKAALHAHHLEERFQVDNTGCHGFCEQGPLVIIEPEGILYCRVREEDVEAIVTEHLEQGRPVERLLYQDPVTKEKIAAYNQIKFYRQQSRHVLKNCGHINPENIDAYLAVEGYQGLKKALAQPREEVINIIKESGLRGRGGAGFPTGLKWEYTFKAPGDRKYVVCNADEGDPGAFMDRSVLEGDPHAVLEGMLIAAYAIGAREGYIYVRAEYPLAVQRLRIALAQARERGFCGERILGTDFSCELYIREGAGAFVCGEETALLASIQGERGMPRPRPPFPARQGLWGQPTNINNVETYANVPLILRRGAGWYASLGTEKSKGTKIFALTGKVKNTGLVEVPMGITLREIIFNIGGGILEDRGFKAVQIGGPSGGCLPAEHLDLPVDYDSLTAAGAMMGSGGLVVMDDSTCMVEVARFFLNFTQAESCGKCTPCREGIQQMLAILTRITRGQGREGDLEQLERLARVIKGTALCGLGQTAPNPVLSTLRYFRAEYEAHIRDHRCPAKSCRELLTYHIDPDKCNGCTRCRRRCPAGAISGEAREPHTIDLELCARCGTCLDLCRQKAIYVE